MMNELKEEMREELKEEMHEELKEEICAEIQDMLVQTKVYYTVLNMSCLFVGSA